MVIERSGKIIEDFVFFVSCLLGGSGILPKFAFKNIGFEKGSLFHSFDFLFHCCFLAKGGSVVRHCNRQCGECLAGS